MEQMTKADREALTDLVCNTREGMSGILRHLFNVCPDSFRAAVKKILEDDATGREIQRFIYANMTNVTGR